MGTEDRHCAQPKSLLADTPILFYQSLRTKGPLLIILIIIIIIIIIIIAAERPKGASSNIIRT